MAVKTLIVNTMPRTTDQAIKQDGGVARAAGSDPPGPPSLPMDTGPRRLRRRRLRRREPGMSKDVEGFDNLP